MQTVRRLAGAGIPVVWGLGLCLALASVVRADTLGTIDTEHMFGFIHGTDIGTPGDTEIESETTSHIGKQTGRYHALSQRIAIEHTPRDNLRLEMSAIGAYHDASAVNGFDDVHRASFQGLSFEARYRLIERQKSGFGLTLLIEPHWSRIDEVSGQRVNAWGTGLAILADTELIKDRLVGVFNLLYSPEASQLRATGTWSRENAFGAGTAMMLQLSPGFLAGIEARYLRAYDSLGFDSYAGHATFVGPTIFYHPSETWRVTAAWSVQVAGRTIDEPGSLDLANFTRHQLRLRLGYHF